MSGAETALHLKYRPRHLNEVIGHEEAVKVLQDMVDQSKPPSALLLLGGTSVGKTTLARCFAADFNGIESGLDGSNGDYLEVNASDKRGVDDVRELARLSRLAPTRGRRRFIMLDEAQQIVSNAHAANCLLAPLERPGKSTTWILTSMSPGVFSTSNLGRAIMNRCTVIQLDSHTDADLYKQAVRIAKGEKATFFTKEALKAVVEASHSEMRTLAQNMQLIISWARGNGENDKLTAEQVGKLISSLASNDDDVDVLAASFIRAVYTPNKNRAALLAALDGSADAFGFLQRILLLHRNVLFGLALGDRRHQRVWQNKASTALLRWLEDDETTRKIVLRNGPAVHDAIKTRQIALMLDDDSILGMVGQITLLARSGQ